MDEITKSMRADIDAAKEATIRFATDVGDVAAKQTGNGPVTSPAPRVGQLIDAVIVALQTRIDALKRVKESL